MFKCLMLLNNFTFLLYFFLIISFVILPNGTERFSSEPFLFRIFKLFAIVIMFNSFALNVKSEYVVFLINSHVC